MADQDSFISDDSAEKAYAAASEAVGAQPVTADAEPAIEAPAPVAEVPAPAAKVPAVPVEAPAAPVVEAAPVAFPPKAARAAAKPKAPAKAKAPAAKPAAAKSPARVAVRAPAKAPVKTPVKAPAKPAPAAQTAFALKAPAAPKAPVAPKASVAPKAPVVSKPSVTSKSKELNMSDTKNFADGIQKIVSESQDKVKQAYAKSASVFGEYGEFAKGNVEAVVESGKIFATGLQDMGKGMIAETKTAFETISADVKKLSSVKSPTDFVKVQGDIVRRNLDHAVALTSKNSEAMLKLATDAFAPISGRVSLAVTKIKKAA